MVIMNKLYSYYKAFSVIPNIRINKASKLSKQMCGAKEQTMRIIVYPGRFQSAPNVKTTDPNISEGSPT
jgi:hypothetical protein